MPALVVLVLKLCSKRRIRIMLHDFINLIIVTIIIHIRDLLHHLVKT